MANDMADEIQYGRDSNHARIFLSSKMDGSLDEERRRAAAAINQVGSHKAWWWEDDAPMGLLHSDVECIKFAATSDGLILLVAGPLSDIVYSEYSAAKDAAAEMYIFVREGDPLPQSVKDFIAGELRTVVSKKFQNTNELESRVIASLRQSAVRAMRQAQTHRQAARS